MSCLSAGFELLRVLACQSDEEENFRSGRESDLVLVSSLRSFYIFRGGAQIGDLGSKTQTRVLIKEDWLELSLYPIEIYNAVPNQWMFLTNATMYQDVPSLSLLNFWIALTSLSQNGCSNPWFHSSAHEDMHWWGPGLCWCLLYERAL